MRHLSEDKPKISKGSAAQVCRRRQQKDSVLRRADGDSKRTRYLDVPTETAKEYRQSGVPAGTGNGAVNQKIKKELEFLISLRYYKVSVQ